MLKGGFIHGKYYNIHMNNPYLNIISTYVPLISAFIGLIWWGGRVNARLEVLEKRADSIDDYFEHIESKLDKVGVRIDDRCDTILNAVLALKS